MVQLIVLLLSLMFCVPSYGVMIIQTPEEVSVEDGFVGWWDDGAAYAYNSVVNMTNDDGVGAAYECTDSGTISRAVVFPANTDTGKEFNVALFNAARTTKLAQGTLTNPSGGAYYMEITLDATYEVSSGTTYYCTYGSKDDNDWQARGTYTGTASVYEDGTFEIENSMPSQFDEDTLHDSSAELLIFFDNGQTSGW